MINAKNKIIDECGFSEEMSEYLKTQDLNEDTLIKIITGAPINLYKKINLYRFVGGWNARIIDLETRKAFFEVLAEKGKIFCLIECWYDDDTSYEKEDFFGLFTSFSSAVSLLRKEIEEEEWDDDFLFWTKILKYVPTESDKMKNTYTYYLKNDEVVYFKNHEYPPNDEKQGYIDSLNLQIPIPFKVGDIITLDATPFAPKKEAILIEVNNNDCCGAQILYRTNNGLWRTGALMHGHGWDYGNGFDYFPILSPLYKLSSFKGELSKKESLMKDVQKFLSEGEENGKNLWKAIYNDEIESDRNGEVREEDIKKYIKEN
jgi:hypothetical protein